MKNIKIGDKITRKQEELVLFPLHRSATGKKISTEIRQQPTNVPLPVK